MQPIKTNISAIARCLLPFTLLCVSAEGFAQTDYLGEVGTTVGTGLTLILNVVRAVVFVIMIWAILTKFGEASRGRASWGEVIVPFIAGAVILAFLAVIAPDAETAIQAIGGGA